MKRYLLMATAFAVILASSLAAQGGRQGGGITRGANQPRQNPWSAKAPWGQTERSAPMELQKKEPFKVFDNVYYTGLQTVASYLVDCGTANGPSDPAGHDRITTARLI